AVEAGIGLTWHRYVGEAGRIVSLEHFGASADADVLFRAFGFTPQAVAQAARDSLTTVKDKAVTVTIEHVLPTGPDGSA
ncbi:transketolase-like TK C-terminal-containing protein, partial [Streptomyces klenkii]|uniref:transketolase-like TK C-terminal-containing protein n=1 Tax=Streptomyces klenkii TaxID=1420899 RepID=UPI00341E518C